MNEEYLWDKTGPPDPEIEHLERTLAPLRHRHRPELVTAGRRPSSKPRLAWAMAAAAALALAALAALQVQIPQAPTNWLVADLEGEAQLGGDRAILQMTVQAGQLVKTDSGAHMQLEAMELGRIDLGPGSELRATSTRKLELNRGEIHAFIWARPGQFIVDTPSARAVDLGCEYTLHVDQNGDGLLKVSRGWVAFQAGQHEAFIPAGAACATRKKQGPGIPYFEDAPDQLREGVAALDQGGLAAILESARSRDGLTLWHLLARVPVSQRGMVFDKFAELVPLPQDITREAAIRLDRDVMDRCWNALELEDTEWWRGWERKWGG